MAGTTIWAPVVSLVLIANPDGFPRQPDNTQKLHSFRANPGPIRNQPWFAIYPRPSLRIEAEGFAQPKRDYSALFGVIAAPQAQSTQWIVGSSIQQVAEFEYDVRRSRPDQLHLYRQAFQTVGQPWQLLFQAPSNRVESEGFTQPIKNYSAFFGATSTSQPTQPWSAYKWTSPIPDIQEFRPQWTNHNLAYAPFQTRKGIVVNQPWNIYRWSIPTPDTTPYVEYRSRNFWSDYLPYTLTPTNPPVVTIVHTRGYVINIGTLMGIR